MATLKKRAAKYKKRAKRESNPWRADVIYMRADILEEIVSAWEESTSQ